MGASGLSRVRWRGMGGQGQGEGEKGGGTWAGEGGVREPESGFSQHRLIFSVTKRGC